MHAHFLSQDPQKSNGKILGYNLTVNVDGHPESLVVTSKEYNITIKGEEALIKLTAYNSAGVSPAATLMIPRRGISI